MRFGSEFRIAISPSDYDRSVAFYRDVLGLQLFNSWDRPSGRGSVFRCGQGLIEVVTGEGSAETPGFFTTVISVENARAAHDEVSARGADATEPRVMPWGHLAFTVKAPDGIELYFFEDVGQH